MKSQRLHQMGQGGSNTKIAELDRLGMQSQCEIGN